MKPDGRNVRTRVREIRSGEGERMDSAPHPKQKLFVRLDPAPEAGDLLRSTASD